MKNKIIKPIQNYFVDWTLKRKMFLIVGISLLFINIIVSILNFYSSATIVLEKINSQEIKEFLSENNLIPSALATTWKTTMTFTNISNYILAIMFIVYPFYWKNKKTQAFVFSSIVWISITFLVYWTLISWNGVDWKNPLTAIKSLIVHVTNPLAGYIMFWIVRKDFEISRKTIWLNNLFILSYFALALIIFLVTYNFSNISTTKVNPYKAADMTVYNFLNPVQPFFYNGTNIFVVLTLNFTMVLLGVFLSPGLAYLIKFIYKIKITKKTKTKND
ncbi:MAGa3780 family membrane protein [Mycoplasma crocodyli]|uniref:MAGa3780 family membrane protein n=1 Tax=Mycoplasma crocodyli TaxID=50052 RepID=UPI0011D15C67|nr:hypothetical protein [Mycoplasma crocodyli]